MEADKRRTSLSRQAFLNVVRDAPLVAIDLIVRDAAGRVLLGLRRGEPAKGFWFVPGGRIHKGRTVAEAFADVSADELGLPLRRGEATFLGVFDHAYPGNFAGVPGCPTQYVVLAYEVRLDVRIESLPTGQHSQWRWLTPEELLADGQVHENTKAYFRKRSPPSTPPTD